MLITFEKAHKKVEGDSYMEDLMRKIQDTADGFTKFFGQTHMYPFIGKDSLDYSVESLEVVDRLLEEMGNIGMDENSVFNVASMVGCYIFETARKNYGGEYLWADREQQPVLVAGLPDFQVSIRAWEKVKGRLINGREDSIPF